MYVRTYAHVRTRVRTIYGQHVHFAHAHKKVQCTLLYTILYVQYYSILNQRHVAVQFSRRQELTCGSRQVKRLVVLSDSWLRHQAYLHPSNPMHPGLDSTTCMYPLIDKTVEIDLDQLTPSSVARVFSVNPTRTSLNVTGLMCLVFLFLYQIISQFC